MPGMKLSDSALLGGVLAVAIGAADAFSRHVLSVPVDLVLIVGGLGALGVHINLS